jgi:hypothetical protein
MKFTPATATLKVALPAGEIPLQFVRNLKARRYIMRVLDGVARVTIPRGGNVHDAWEFAQRCRPWVERELQKKPVSWGHGTIILLRGEPVELSLETTEGSHIARVGPHEIAVTAETVREKIEGFLMELARSELVPLTRALALQHQVSIQKVAIKDQRSRWGSCSVRGTISLNWRLIQTPRSVQEYIIIHELMHLREMNHSSRFWAHVAAACPDYLVCEKWLRSHSALLR